MHSPRGVLLDCLYNYIFNRFPGKQIQKLNVELSPALHFLFTATNCFPLSYLWSSIRVITCDAIPGFSRSFFFNADKAPAT